MVAIIVAMSAAQVLVPVESTVEDEPVSVVETVDQIEDDSTGETRPKRQFLAGYLLGSLAGGHRYGYGGYGGYGHRPHYRPHYGGYGGYRYGYEIVSLDF